MMTPNQIKLCVIEAERFIKRANYVLDTSRHAGDVKWDNHPINDRPSETGALRRASMDLTRELAKLRVYDR